MGGFFDPTGFNFITNLMNQVGGSATASLQKTNPTGYGTLRKTFGALSKNPATALPGGGTGDTGIQAQTAKEDLPAASAPLFQQQRQQKIGLASEEGGAANLGASQDILGQQYRAALQSIIGPLFARLGITTPGSGGSQALGGAGGFLMKLLS
jgi:hypothetical protein